MLSKLLILVVAALSAQTIDSICDSTPTSEIQPYHSCPRSMNTWLRQNYSIVLRCAGGFRQNKCSSNSDCNPDGDNTYACCQQNSGCNTCVVVCPLYPIPRSGCKSGYSAYNGPTGCVSYQCNENLPSLIEDDNAAVAVALAALQKASFNDLSVTTPSF